MKDFCWKDTVKDKPINTFQRDSDIDILKLEPSNKYTYDDFLYAYNFEKDNGKNFVVSGQILTKMIMPYIYNQTNEDLKPYRNNIIMDCYLGLVTSAIPNLNIEKIKTANNPANMLCGYCKLYCKDIISNAARGNISISWYNKGYRKELNFSETKIIKNIKLEKKKELNTEGFLDNEGYYTSNIELKEVEDDLKYKQLITGLYATIYKMKFTDRKLHVNINQLLRDYDNLLSENRKTVIEYGMENLRTGKGIHTASERYKTNIRISGDNSKYHKEKIVGISKNAKTEDVKLFLNKFILNLNETQLDEFIETQHVYDKIGDILDKFDIKRPDNSPFGISYKEIPSTWDRLVRNHIQIDYNASKESNLNDNNYDYEER